MEFKGTKGDWHVETSNISPMLEYGKKVYVSTKSDFIALIFGNSKQELKSNAQLISKAQEMLEMLKDCVEAIDWYMENSNPNFDTETFFNLGANTLNQAEDLIKKATEI